MGAEQSTAKVADDKTTTNSDIETPPIEEPKPEEQRPPNIIIEEQQQQEQRQPDRKTSYQPPTPNTTPILKSESPTEESGRKIEVVPADLTDSIDIVRKWIK